MTPENNPKEWIRIAEMDLSSSHHLYENHRPKPLEIICFHTQQAAEKMLKCFLVVHKIEIPRIHDLNVLLNMCFEINEKFDEIFNPITSLNRYSVLPRYPNELQIEDHDALLALENADTVMDFVKNNLSVQEQGIDLDKAD